MQEAPRRDGFQMLLLLLLLAIAIYAAGCMVYYALKNM
jgi:hypothetical protein